jgi:hypothetical protein
LLIYIINIFCRGVSGVANSGSYDITQVDGTNGLTSQWKFGTMRDVCFFFSFPLLQNLSCSFSSWVIQPTLVPIVVLSFIDFFSSFNFIAVLLLLCVIVVSVAITFGTVLFLRGIVRGILPDPMAVENLDENLDDKVRILFKVTIFFSAECLRQIGEEALKIYLEEEDSLAEHIDALIAKSLEDFPEDDTSDSAARHAAEITRASITDGTRGGHIR